MSIASEITRLQNAKSDLKTSINSKLDGVEITDELLDEYATFVDQIQTGGSTNVSNEFDLLFTGNYGYMTEEVCSNIIEGNYIYIM